MVAHRTDATDRVLVLVLLTVPSTPRKVVDREAARVLLVDGAGRVLLFEGLDPADRDGGSWWFTPGGGLEGEESAEQAAHRELWEETGLRVPRLAGPVAERRSEFAFDGLLYRQHELYFAAALEATDVVVGPVAHTELEVRSVLRWHWWSADELARTQERVYPPWLARWLARTVTEGLTNRYPDEAAPVRDDA
ncbi:NUDIX hydrolase [Jannaschia sp. R86511]|uniref:NUDIX hydrolase n=1 Tax=Jannaschia sp. R86511 TaxID=3093853 RepID=UPI0036D3CF11